MRLPTIGMTTALVLGLMVAAPLASSTASAAGPAPGIPLPTCADAMPTMVGTPDPDQLGGTPGDDVIFGLAGGDQIDGAGGNDLICGGRGSDSLDGGDGEDRVFGQADKVVSTGTEDAVHIGDLLYSSPGDDVLDAGTVSDEAGYKRPEIFDFSTNEDSAVTVDLRAGTADSDTHGHDTLVIDGVNHARKVIGTAFDDHLLGSIDDDVFDAGPGDDVVRARAGADVIKAGDGDDELVGGPDHDGSRDPIEPSAGADTLVPGRGDDLLKPGGDPRGFAASGDILRFDSTFRSVTVDLAHGTANGQGFDRLVIGGAVKVIGGGSDDNLFGSKYADLLVGRSGLDRLEGRQGDDELYGDGLGSGATEPGRDALFGGDGADLLDGGALRDLLAGGLGDDLDVDTRAVNTCTGVERHNPSGC